MARAGPASGAHRGVAANYQFTSHKTSLTIRFPFYVYETSLTIRFAFYVYGNVIRNQNASNTRR
jgi:hypothetical protein